MATPRKSHSTGDVWNAVNNQREQIASVQAAQEATEVRLAGLEKKFDEGFDEIRTAIESLNATIHRPVNWLGIWSGIIATVGGMVMFVIIYSAPLFDQMRERRQEVSEVKAWQLESAETHGAQEERAKWVTRDLDRNHERLLILEEAHRQD